MNADAIPLVNEEAERAVLATVIAHNDARDHLDELRPEHFAVPGHRRLFEASCRMIDRGEVVTLVTLKPLLVDEAVKALGGGGYLARMMASAEIGRGLKQHAEMVRGLALRRGLIEAAREIQIGATSPDPDKTAQQMLEEAEQRIFALARHEEGKGPILVGEAVDAALAHIDFAAENKGKLIGVTTALVDIDRLTGGLVKGEKTVIAGRPGMGKSTLAKTVALGAARAGHKVAYFSLEMPKETLAMWLLADLTGISADRQRRGDIGGLDALTLRTAGDELRQLGLWIDDRTGLSVAQIRARCRRIQRRGGLDLVIADHIGHIAASPAARKKSNQTAEVTEITRDLLGLAKDLGVAVVELSQLSRGVEGRDDKRPTLADLRDSGSIEQDAHNVMFVYRPEYYLDGREPERKQGESDEKYNGRLADHHAELERVRGIMEIIVAKNRTGPRDTVRAKFEPERSRVANLYGGTR